MTRYTSRFRLSGTVNSIVSGAAFADIPRCVLSMREWCSSLPSLMFILSDIIGDREVGLLVLFCRYSDQRGTAGRWEAALVAVTSNAFHNSGIDTIQLVLLPLGVEPLHQLRTPSGGGCHFTITVCLFV